MAREILVKRTIWVAKCDCGNQKIVDDNPPKEMFCIPCKKWVPYVEESYTGPSLKK